MEKYTNPYNLETDQAEPTKADLTKLIRLAEKRKGGYQMAELNESAKDVNFMDPTEENLEKPKLHLLIRLSSRLFKGSDIDTLDIVRVSLPTVLKRKGVLTRTIENLADLASPRKIRIESASTPEMVDFIKRGKLRWERQTPSLPPGPWTTSVPDYTDYILVGQKDEEAKEDGPKGGATPRRKYYMSSPDRRFWTELVYILENNGASCCEKVETAIHYIWTNPKSHFEPYFNEIKKLK